jgi:CDP-glycerol glycerophosphotransferase (TagB/SpsB family)
MTTASFDLLPPAARPNALICASSTVIRVFLPLLSNALSRLFRVDKKVWVFGFQGMQGVHEFADNSKYLFLGASNAFKGLIRPIWISWTPGLAIMLRNRGYESYWVLSARGLRLTLRAGCVFSHMGLGGIMQKLVGCGRALRVELWHGIPLKKVDVSVHADYVVATSEPMRNVFATSLRVPPSRVIVSGYPRNDALLKRVRGYDIGIVDILDSLLKLKKSARIVLYAPTFRDNLSITSEELLQYLHLDKTRLDAVLRGQEAYMIAKFHHAVRPTKTNHALQRLSERIYVINDPIDLYPILSIADVLVTDYSSVYFDFLLLDRPIVFYVPDYEKYLQERGFCLDFDSYTPGPKAKSFEELLLALRNVLTQKDRFVEQRKNVREHVFDYVDGLSSHRLVKSVIEILRLQKTQALP